MEEILPKKSNMVLKSKHETPGKPTEVAHQEQWQYSAGTKLTELGQGWDSPTFTPSCTCAWLSNDGQGPGGCAGGRERQCVSLCCLASSMARVYAYHWAR